MATHVYRTTAANVHPAMGIEIGGDHWFVRDVTDSTGQLTFSLELTGGAHGVGFYPPKRRQWTASPRAELRAIRWQ